MALALLTFPSPPSLQCPSSDSITLTPRSSFYTTTNYCAAHDSSTRPNSLCSIDSGYASTVGPRIDLMPLRRKRSSSSTDVGVCSSGDPPKPKRSLFLQGRKKSPDDTSFPRSSWHRISTRKDETRISTDDEDDDGDGDGDGDKVHSPASAFEARHHFTTRRGMAHHPYPLDQVPYMQAYDRTLLDNDRFSDILLQRLSINGSPSFLPFNGHPPSAILDIGCGAGHWAIRAAKHWPKARIIGIDLIAPSRLNDGVVTPPNVEWRQMNFIGHRLGFPSNMFDLVRMANLSICIPLENWNDVLSEVKRVLAPGGRLELIDDQIIFPTVKSLETPKAVPDIIIGPSHGDSYIEFDDDDDDGDLSSFDDDSDDDFKSAMSHPSSIRSEVASYDAVSERSRNEANAKALEGLFTDMLSSKYNIHADQRETIEESIDAVFGRYNSQRVTAMTLSIAPPVSSSNSEPDRASVSSGDSKSLKKKGETFKHWISVGDKVENKGKKGDRSSRESVLSPIPEVISPKAAGRLGISHSSTTPPSPQSPRSRRSSVTPPPSRSTQSPGLILWPNMLIELAPFELEMHACKHMHTLLGCKAALFEYAEQLYRDADGKSFLDDTMFDDLIWDYECFRRKRFNWPSMSSETESSAFDEPIVSPTFRHSADLSSRAQHLRRESDTSIKQSESSRYSKDELTFVRSIHVYSASKITMDDLILS